MAIIDFFDRGWRIDPHGIAYIQDDRGYSFQEIRALSCRHDDAVDRAESHRACVSVAPHRNAATDLVDTFGCKSGHNSKASSVDQSLQVLPEPATRRQLVGFATSKYTHKILVAHGPCDARKLVILGELRESAAAKILFRSFGAAIVLTMAALAAFVIEILLTTRGVRRTVDQEVGKSAGGAQEPG